MISFTENTKYTDHSVRKIWWQVGSLLPFEI
jgi:hypothetical protein